MLMQPDKVLILAIMLVILTSCASGGGQYSDSSSSGPSPAAINVQLGVGYIREGNYEVALEKLKKAVRLDPKNASAHTTIGFLYETIGDLDKAGYHYRKSSSLDPEGGETNSSYGQFLCKMGRWKQAQNHFDAALKDPFYATPEVALNNAGWCAMRVPDHERAEKYFREALDLRPKFADPMLPLAEIYYVRKDYFRARAFIQRYESVASHDMISLYRGFLVESALGDTKSATDYANRLKKYYPESIEATKVKKAQDG